jgi:hypothetical protein
MPSVSLDAVDLWAERKPTKTALNEKLKTSQHEKPVNTHQNRIGQTYRPRDELDDLNENNTFTN